MIDDPFGLVRALILESLGSRAVHSRGPTVWATNGGGAFKTMTDKLNAISKAFPGTVLETSIGFLIGVSLLYGNDEVMRRRESSLYPAASWLTRGAVRLDGLSNA